MGMRSGYTSQNVGSVGRYYTELKVTLGGSATSVTATRGAGMLAQTGGIVHVGGTNVWTFTMRDAWPEVVVHSVDVRDDAGNGAYATLGSFTNEGTGTAVPAPPITFKLQTWTAGGAALNDSTLVVVIALALRNSNETYGN